MSGFDARVGGEPAEAEITPEALVVGDRTLAWVDLDHLTVADHQIHLRTFEGQACTISHLSTGFDRFVMELTEARGRARRAALLQWTGDAPIEVFDAKRGDERVRVHLFPDGLTVEPLTGVPDMLPLSCLAEVERNGYDLRLLARGLPHLSLRHFGNRTDEFLQRLDRAQADLAARTSAAYAELDPALAALPASDGWAIDESEAGGSWSALRGALDRGRRADEIALLAELAGEKLRLGIKCGPSIQTMPFALAPIGTRIVVEAADTDDRATFVFETTDAERLNAVLLATSFRREAIASPPDRLGRWALAVRTLEVVRWARAALVERIVHDASWEPRLRAALS